jgi:hypothetical protein
MWRPKESLKSWPGMSEDPKRTMEKPLTALLRADGRPLGLEEYEKHGGYEVLKKVLRTMTPQEVQDAVKAANLRGRGGAGFGTGSKWSFVPMGESAPRPKFLICNSDEMEPGAFKDRVLMEGNPHQLIEGMIIAAYAIEASEAYVFLRWAYRQSAASVRGAIREAYEAGYVGGGIKEGHAESKAAVSPGERALGQADCREQHGDPLERAPHTQEWRGVVQDPEPVDRRRNQDIHGERESQETRLLGTPDGDYDPRDYRRTRRRHEGRVRSTGSDPRGRLH